jgi:hypothetical protein
VDLREREREREKERERDRDVPDLSPLGPDCHRHLPDLAAPPLRAAAPTPDLEGLQGEG